MTSTLLTWARAALDTALAVACLYVAATYRTPAEDGESNRSEMRPSVSQ